MMINKTHQTVALLFYSISNVLNGSNVVPKFISPADLIQLDQFCQRAYSSKETLYKTFELTQQCLLRNIAGDFVECGVAAGSQIAAMAYACKKAHQQRIIHLFDSFEGIPLAGPHDETQPGIGAISHDVHVPSEALLVSSNITVHTLESVIENMKIWNIDISNFIFHKGWFQHTLPQVTSSIDKIALLRLDGDLYESTKVCLEYLYPKISQGGYIIIDDYALSGCRKAVHEYLEKHNLHPTILPTDSTNGPVFWQVQ